MMSATEPTAQPPHHHDETGNRTGPVGSLRKRPALILALVLIAMLVLAGLSRTVTSPQDADAESTEFSAARATEAARTIVDEPRTVGSIKGYEAFREIYAALKEEGLEVSTHEGVSATGIKNRARAGHTRNLIATRPGTNPTGTLVLATHYDTVVGAPGAADAGVGIAVILETVRALGPEAKRNDLVVLMVDGEEFGMLGAKTSVRDALGDLKEPVVVINHEARGMSGRPIVTRTAGPMQDILQSMPRPEAESFFGAMFQFIPNYTDFTVYSEDGHWWGMDIALIDEAWAYHSPQDSQENLDPASVQHYGDMVLAISRDVLDRDLGALAEQQSESVTTTMPWGLIHLPSLVVMGLAAAGAVALAVRAVVQRRRGLLTLRGVAAGALSFLLMLLFAGVAAVALWGAVQAIWPQILSDAVGEPVRGRAFAVAEILVAAGLGLLVHRQMRRFASREAVSVGAALLLAVLLAIGTAAMPQLLGWLAIPTALAALAGLVAVLLPPTPGLVMRVIGMLPLGWMIGRMLDTQIDFGIASANGLYAATVVMTMTAALPLLSPRPEAVESAAVQRRNAALPQGASPGRAPVSSGPVSLGPTGERAPGILGSLLLATATVIGATGLSLAGVWWTQAAGQPAQHRIQAFVDADTGAVRWVAPTSTSWGRVLGMMTEDATDVFVEPQVRATREGDLVRLEMTSRRHADRFEIRVAGSSGDHKADAHLPEFSDITVDGEELPPGLTTRRVTVVGLKDKQTAVVQLKAPAGTSVTVGDVTYNLMEVPGMGPPGDQISIPRPHVEVYTTIDLP